MSFSCIKKDGGFTSFRIRTNTSEGLLKTVWELTDHAMFADNRWMVGQVQVNSKLILFEVKFHRHIHCKHFFKQRN